MITVSVMIIVPVVIVEVAVLIVIPVVIVFNAAALPLPVSRVISFAVVVRCDPVSSFVGWPCPIAFMPFVMLSDGIPITLYPRESWFWHCGNDRHARRRWRSNGDSDGNLCLCIADLNCRQQHRN